jgi:hypothetical protein
VCAGPFRAQSGPARSLAPVRRILDGTLPAASKRPCSLVRTAASSQLSPAAVSARSLARSLVLLQIYGKTHYHLEGPSYAKELVVFIHGVGDYGYRFECMANAMNAAGYRTLRFDIFGRGFSESPDDCRYDVDMYVGHVQSLLQRLELADMPVTVVGHSMGGLVVRSPPSIPLPLPLPLSSFSSSSSQVCALLPAYDRICGAL